MPLYTPDRQITPDDPKDEPEAIKECIVCYWNEKESKMVKDFIQENHICNEKSCIEDMMETDLEHQPPSTHDKITEYYDKLLNELK